MAKCLLFIIFISLSIIFGAYVSISIVDELWDWRLLVREGNYGKLLNNLEQNERDRVFFRRLAVWLFSNEISKRPYPGYLDTLSNGLVFTIKTTSLKEGGVCKESISDSNSFTKVESFQSFDRKIISSVSGLCKLQYSVENRLEKSNMLLAVETLAGPGKKKNKITYSNLDFFPARKQQFLTFSLAEGQRPPLINRVIVLAMQRSRIADKSWLKNYYSDSEMKKLISNLKKVGVVLSYFKHEIKN